MQQCLTRVRLGSVRHFAGTVHNNGENCERPFDVGPAVLHLRCPVPGTEALRTQDVCMLARVCDSRLRSCFGVARLIRTWKSVAYLSPLRPEKTPT
jgi:hypothetical protein